MIVVTDCCFMLQAGFAAIVVYRGKPDSSFNISAASLPLLYIYLGLSCVLLVPLSHLIGLHVYLVSHDLTTYEWIKKRRELRVKPNNKPADVTTVADSSVKVSVDGHLRTVQDTQTDTYPKLDESTIIISPDKPQESFQHDCSFE